jgi:hypothetical protein
MVIFVKVEWRQTISQRDDGGPDYLIEEPFLRFDWANPFSDCECGIVCSCDSDILGVV